MIVQSCFIQMSTDWRMWMYLHICLLYMPILNYKANDTDTHMYINIYIYIGVSECHQYEPLNHLEERSSITDQRMLRQTEAVW